MSPIALLNGHGFDIMICNISKGYCEDLKDIRSIFEAELSPLIRLLDLAFSVVLLLCLFTITLVCSDLVGLLLGDFPNSLDYP